MSIPRRRLQLCGEVLEYAVRDVLVGVFGIGVLMVLEEFWITDDAGMHDQSGTMVFDGDAARHDLFFCPCL